MLFPPPGAPSMRTTLLCFSGGSVDISITCGFSFNLFDIGCSDDGDGGGRGGDGGRTAKMSSRLARFFSFITVSIFPRHASLTRLSSGPPRRIFPSCIIANWMYTHYVGGVSNVERCG